MMVQQRFENENCEYAETYGSKNCYLSFGVGQQAENILYSSNSYDNIRNILNSFSVITNSDNIYSSKIITQSYQIFYSSNVHNSSDIRFSNNLMGCRECLFCYDLSNQSYCINNQTFSADDYYKQKEWLLKQKENFIDRHNKVC